MKNKQGGFVIPLAITVVALLIAVGGYYVYEKNKKSDLSDCYPPSCMPGRPKPTPVIIPVDNSKANDATATPEGIKEVISANNQFALKMYSEFKGENKNIFFSPYSISTALAMVYEGAKGETASEIQKVFGFPMDSVTRQPAFAAIHNEINSTNSKYKLNIANALWAQTDYKFLDSYINTLKDYYSSKAVNLDFVNNTEQSRLTINKWVEASTNNKIKDLFPVNSIDRSTRLVLTNAIYFKGTWAKQFNKRLTEESDFNVNSSLKVKVQMMKQTGGEANFNYAVEEDGLQIIEMPYQGDKLSMLILLPKIDNMSSLEQSLSLEKIGNIKSRLHKKRVDIYIPKFTFDTKYFMKDTLTKMGMPTAFSETADFSGMDGTRSLYIGTVIHQAFVDVNEEGTEAAAATGIGMRATSAKPQDPIIFKADHPFIFVIQNKENGNILFMGKVVNPTK